MTRSSKANPAGVGRIQLWLFVSVLAIGLTSLIGFEVWATGSLIRELIADHHRLVDIESRLDTVNKRIDALQTKGEQNEAP